MKLTTILASLFVGVAIAADANSVSAKIDTLNSRTQALDTTIKKYNGGLLGIPTALQIQVDSVNVFFALNDIINEANASDQFDAAGSKKVVATVKKLVPTVQTTLKDLEGKKSAFADLGPLALASLYQLRQASFDFAISLAGKLQTDDVSDALDQYTLVDNTFKSAIVTYGGVGKF